jgi:hypothetical protein
VGCPVASLWEGPGGEGLEGEGFGLEGFELVGLADWDGDLFFTDAIFYYNFFMCFDELFIILDRDFFH